jgi:hypothetical protein
MAGTSAADRIRSVLQAKADSLGIPLEKLRGLRGPKREQEIVALFAGDIVECCRAVVDPDPTIKMLERGSASSAQEAESNIYADHAFYVLDRQPIVMAPPAEVSSAPKPLPVGDGLARKPA